jgi:hypothetical protein
MSRSVCTTGRALQPSDRHILFEDNYPDISRDIATSVRAGLTRTEVALQIVRRFRCSNLLLKAVQDEITYQMTTEE